MKIVIQLTVDEEAKALPLLLRHSPGSILRDRIYILDPNAVRALRDAGIRYTELTRDGSVPDLQRIEAGERI